MVLPHAALCALHGVLGMNRCPIWILEYGDTSDDIDAFSMQAFDECLHVLRSALVGDHGTEHWVVRGKCNLARVVANIDNDCIQFCRINELDEISAKRRRARSALRHVHRSDAIRRFHVHGGWHFVCYDCGSRRSDTRKRD